MEGDEDWVSTSPIKLALPPARRAFTPGRVLSRDEIRQQRRRAPDHPQPRLNSLPSTSKGLFDQPSAQTAQRNDAAQMDGSEGTAAQSSTSAHPRTTTLSDRSPRRNETSAHRQATQRDHNVISDPTAGPSGTPPHTKKYGQISFPPMPKPARAMVPSPSSQQPVGNERIVDVSVRVETKLIAEARLRESVSPVPNSAKVAKRLFNPSPSTSTSPPFPRIQVEPRAVNEDAVSGSAYVSLKEENAPSPNGSAVASERSSAASSHVSEDLPSPSPPRKRVRKADITNDYEHSHSDDRRSLSSPNQNQTSRPSKKQKRPLSVDGAAEPTDLAAEWFQEDEHAHGNDVPVHISPRLDMDLAHRAVDHWKPRSVDSLQGLVDWTWPAVQQSLRDSRSGNTTSTNVLQKLENCLHRHLTNRIAKLEELQDLQSKRRKEAEKTRKIQTERTSLAIRMREEDRLWQKSRRAFRINIGLHEAAVRVAAESAGAHRP